ncbi:MAG: autotransporter-associated beta strand repeat-containing protein [Akkermansiaceae bacterium]|nr:autotransporter-associated beta strand repeat-containing protein [Akkermansiaceae bacterium]MCP5546931.1 autotransporter-associated beta strand repeat-containing protein [Akkermansiaceae bacterium]
MKSRIPNLFRSHLATVFSMAALTGFAVPPALADTATWTGDNATDGQWNRNTWENFGGVFATNSNDVVFGSTNTNNWTTTSIGGSRTIASLTFQAGSPAYDIRLTGGVTATNIYHLTFNSTNTGITVASGDTSSHVIGQAGVGGTVILAGNLTVAHDGSGTLVFLRPITGTGFGVTKTGSGTMILDAANTYDGATQVDGGLLLIKSLDAYGSTSGVTVGASGSVGIGIGSTGTTTHYEFTDVVDLFNTNTLTGFNLDPASGVAVDTTASSFSVINQGGAGTGLTGTRSLTILGTKTLQLNQTNTYTGATLIKEGGLNVGAGLNGGKLSPDSVITVESGATFGINLQRNASQGTDFSSAPVTGGGNFIKYLDNTVTLNAANTYAGTTNVGGGLLKYEGGATLALTPGNLSLSGGGVIGLAEDLTRSRGTGDNEVQWTGSGGFAAIGADRTVSLGGGGNVQWNNGSFVPAGQSLILGDEEATHTVTFTNNINFAGGSRTIQVDDGAADIDAIMSGTLGLSTATNGSLIKSGAGTLELASTSFYTGSTTISAGTLALGSTGSIASSASLAIGEAAILGTADGTSYSAGTLSVTGAATIDLGTGATLSFADSSAVDWSGGTLDITGDFVSGTSLRFGTTNAALTEAQLLLITVNGAGGPFSLDADGYLIEGGTAGYDGWAATNAPTTNPDEDEDGDGVTNGVEYVLGGGITTNDQDKLPGITTSGGNMLFTFERDQASIDGSTTVEIEVSLDLTDWSTSYAVPDDAAANDPGVTVVKDTPVGFDTVTLSLPMSPDTKKFARLKVVP